MFRAKLNAMEVHLPYELVIPFGIYNSGFGITVLLKIYENIIMCKIALKMENGLTSRHFRKAFSNYGKLLFKREVFQSISIVSLCFHSGKHRCSMKVEVGYD